MSEDFNDERKNERARIILLTGFLGSGKTTLLKRILSWETDLSGTAVLVNELGQVGIDGSLVKNAGSDVVELTSGCVCCTIKADLSRSLKDIWNRFRPERIFLEATGVAEPDAVASVLEDDELNQQMTMQKIITVLDIRFWVGREKFGPFFLNQVNQANLILLNKIDTLEKNQVSECLKEIHSVIPGCHVIPTVYCEVDPETLWSDNHKKTPGFKMLDFYASLHTPMSGHEHYHDDHSHHCHDREEHAHSEAQGFIAFDFSASEPMDMNRFQNFLKNVPWEVFRIKGPVRFVDRTILLNFVAGASDWEAWDGEYETRLVFVGWNVDGSRLLEELKTCVQGRNTPA